ncbi:hypothetical protein DICVIV_14001 [Dictyocaulus viviparus]|uniref:Uncharacterized protein n=1 Tax=Dictyocaulus viviparus TaxID=29172 RepID=A0A0D8XC71_DICVI|nr:hypothetical protein DICVIV_14001 [Dictyocaulus viviparus]
MNRGDSDATLLLFAAVTFQLYLPCSSYISPKNEIDHSDEKKIFNIIGGVSLWVHTSKPTGHSTSIRGAATISTVACVYTIGIIILYCKQKPMHPSLKELRADKKLPTSTKQKVKEKKNERKAKNNESVGTNKNKSKIIQLNETQLRKNDVNDEKKRQQSR